MAAKDGLICRIKPPLARLLPDQARALADVAGRFGSGEIFLTSRGNLQIRAVSHDDHPLVVSALDRIGLLDQTEDAEARRNITIAPDWADGDLTHRIAIALSASWTASTLPVPAKFGLAIDTGDAPILGAASADIRVERDAQGLILRPDGWRCGKRVAEADIPDAVQALAAWFMNGDKAADRPGRMADLLRVCTPPSDFDMPAPSQAPAPRPGAFGPGWLVAVPGARLVAEQMFSLAALGALRLTPFRAILIEAITRAPDLPDLITDVGDPRLRAVDAMDLVLDGAQT